LDNIFYFIVIGLGLVWLGSQIIWVAGLPKQLKSHKVQIEFDSGSQEAFMAFWFNQYSWIGTIFVFLGIICFLVGLTT